MSSPTIEHISAITLAVREMKRAIEFYEKLGFELFHGGAGSSFSSLRARQALVNLTVLPEHPEPRWGRVIFRVADVDAQYRAVTAAGLSPDHAPRDASWGERYFHIHDPDGHELSFAQLLRGDPSA